MARQEHQQVKLVKEFIPVASWESAGPRTQNDSSLQVQTRLFEYGMSRLVKQYRHGVWATKVWSAFQISKSVSFGQLEEVMALSSPWILKEARNQARLLLVTKRTSRRPLLVSKHYTLEATKVEYALGISPKEPQTKS